MGIPLAFAPFIAFAIVDLLVNPTLGLIAGQITSFVLLVRDLMTPGKKPKILEIGTALLFTGLAVYAVFGDVHWPIAGVRLRVDGGLLLIVLATIALQQPFTLQYARETVAEEHWSSPEFIRANYVITAVWAGAFAILVLADLALLCRPDLPRRASIIATVIAIWGAFKFTQWYPNRNTIAAR